MSMLSRFNLYRTPLFIAFLLFGMMSCSVLQKKTSQKSDAFDMEYTLLDTLDILADNSSGNKVYRPTAKTDIDIIHTRLQLRFDWERKHVIGSAHITLKPYFKPVSFIELDAVGFDIRHITMGKDYSPVEFSYDNDKITILLGREYHRHEVLDIHIDYVAKPDENAIKGSEAITSDKGLFFINPQGKDADLPTQIWTQGQTENNSKWFPTFDKPNERFTQEIILTVEDKYQTISNGIRISSVVNNDGTRTDHWKLDKAHPPYLAMIAVGEFDVEMDEWQGMPVHYYVEKGFGKHARKIFNHTKEMLSFFSDVLRHPYPWDKYSQVVVSQFVSGAMENTGAVIFGDFVQKTERELIDDDNDYIVAHEMMHHWFGNWVTCEDWSNLTLNEGFANYAEYLWMEYKYGRDRADFHRINELNGYFRQVYEGGGVRNVIDYYYNDKEDMFDAHSYNKGGLVLHMLRYYLGDDVFFASLNTYLEEHKGTAVEVDELRMAFEEVSGEDLKWFFNQWFLSPGHPHIQVTYHYNEEEKSVVLETDLSGTPESYYQNFVIPLRTALYFPDGSVTYHPIVIDKKQQVFVLTGVLTEPATYVLDGENVLAGVIDEKKTSDMFRYQFLYSPLLLDQIMGFTGSDEYDKVMMDKALTDDFYYIRAIGIQAMSEELLSEYEEKLEDMVLKDPHSEVRAMALIKLLEAEDFDPLPLCRLILTSERAYPVIEVALQILSSADPESEGLYFNQYKNEESDYLVSTLTGLLSFEKDEYLDYLEEKAARIKLPHLFDFYESYQNYLVGKSLETLERTSKVMMGIATDSDMNMFRRYAATMTLVKISDDLADDSMYIPTQESQALRKEIQSMISRIKAQETHPSLMERYSNLE
jgi:aminopeptidase N